MNYTIRPITSKKTGETYYQIWVGEFLIGTLETDDADAVEAVIATARAWKILTV